MAKRLLSWFVTSDHAWNSENLDTSTMASHCPYCTILYIAFQKALLHSAAGWRRLDLWYNVWNVVSAFQIWKIAVYPLGAKALCTWHARDTKPYTIGAQDREGLLAVEVNLAIWPWAHGKASNKQKSSKKIRGEKTYVDVLFKKLICIVYSDYFNITQINVDANIIIRINNQNQSKSAFYLGWGQKLQLINAVKMIFLK